MNGRWKWVTRAVVLSVAGLLGCWRAERTGPQPQPRAPGSAAISDNEQEVGAMIAELEQTSQWDFELNGAEHAAPPNDAWRDYELIQGSWEAVASEKGGKAVKPPVSRYTFAADFLIMDRDGRRIVHAFRMRTESEPRQLDMVFVGSSLSLLLGSTTEGIYQLDGDELKWCLASKSYSRPDAFETAEGDGRTLWTLRRVRPKEIRHAETVRKLQALEAMVAVDGDGDVLAVDLSGCNVGDDDLALLRDLTELLSVMLSGNARVTDAGLAALEPLRKLREVSLLYTGVTDEAVATLRTRMPATRFFTTREFVERLQREADEKRERGEPIDLLAPQGRIEQDKTGSQR